MHAFARRTLLAASAVVAAAGLVLASAAPAMARSTPAEDKTYALTCEDIILSSYSVNTADAAATLIATHNPLAGQVCALQGAYDAVSGRIYFANLRDLDGALWELREFNPVTGLTTEIGRFQLANQTAVGGRVLAIGTDGAAYLISGDNDLYSLNLSTAVVTLIGHVDSFQQITGFAVDPTTGAFWVASDDGLSTIDVTTAAISPPSPFDFPGGTSIGSLSIDSAGVFWVLNHPMEDPSPSELWSRTSADGTNEFSGDLVVGEEELVYAQSLIIVPAKKLPPTGADASVTLAAGFGVLLIGGALLLVRRRAA